MAHIRSRLDLNHVPTPLAVMDALCGVLSIPEGCVILDPCCGTGEAVRLLSRDANILGIEMDEIRAAEARTRLTRVLACPVQDARIQRHCAGLLFLNPPYDDSTSGRLEQIFLDKCTKWLAPGGVLVLIIKGDRFDTVMARLMRDYDVLCHGRFPDPYFSGPELDFGQTVLVATKRQEEILTRNAWSYRNRDLRFNCNEADELEPFDVRDGWERDGFKFVVPRGHSPHLFEEGTLPQRELLRMVRESAVPRAMRLPSIIGVGRPPITLKQGHVALTLSSGVINGIYGSGESLHIAKGTVARTESKSTELDHTPSGKAAINQHTVKGFCVRIRALTPDGKIHDVTGTPAVTTATEEVEE